MDYDTAMEARISPRRAIAELYQHDIADGYVNAANQVIAVTNAFDIIDGREVPDIGYFPIGPDGLVSGAAILIWLGY